MENNRRATYLDERRSSGRSYRTVSRQASCEPSTFERRSCSSNDGSSYRTCRPISDSGRWRQSNVQGRGRRQHVALIYAHLDTP